MKIQKTFPWFIAILFVTLSSSNCARVVVNSAQSDELIASVGNLPGAAKFKAAIPYVLAKCANCHQHAAWYGYGEDKYVELGLVQAGFPESSSLYYRNVNATEGPANAVKNMPQGGGAALSDEELTLLKDWITNFGT